MAAVVGCGLVAFALRATFALANHANHGVGIDSIWYGWVSAGIAHGHPINFFWGTDVGGQLHTEIVPTAAHGILFPLLLGGARVLGATTGTAEKLIGCGLGACAVVAVGFVGRELGGPRVGLFAAALAAIYPLLIEDDSLLMSESLYGVLCALAVLTALHLRRRPGVWRAVAFGSVVGLAALTRSEGLLLLPFLGIPLLWSVRGRWRHLGIAAAAAVVAISPWVIRNWQVFGRPALATNIGSVLIAANCRDTYYGSRIGGWSAPCFAAASRHGVDRNELHQSDRWSREARAYAQKHGSRQPLILAARILRTFNLYPLDPGQQARVAQAVTGASRGFNLLCVWAGLAVLALAAVGFRFTGREARLALLPLIAVTVALVGLTESLPRLRQGGDLALIILAAHALAHIGKAHPPPRQQG
jgi:4-amino-4-deoxy-L-arabinose transferase-like glycosyltransferase